jgi:hypothetical protein
MFELAEEAVEEESQGRRRPDVPPLRRAQELFDRIKTGEIGDILVAAGYRMAGPTVVRMSSRSRNK